MPMARTHERRHRLQRGYPRYLHLHACVANILQRSGAGSVIDKILGCLPYPSRTRHPEDLQEVLTTLGLRYSLITALQLPQIDIGGHV